MWILTPHISYREDDKTTSIYVTAEQKEAIKKIKKEQGLRSLRQSYEIWKKAKEAVAQENTVHPDEGIAVFPGILHEFNKDDPELEELVFKQSSEINRLTAEIKDLQIAVATRDATIKVLEKEIQLLRAKRGYKTRKQNNDTQRTVKEFLNWAEVEKELDDTKIY